MIPTSPNSRLKRAEARNTAKREILGHRLGTNLARRPGDRGSSLLARPQEARLETSRLENCLDLRFP